MNKNYMGTIAQMLGVELGEQFKVYALETLWGKVTLSDKGVVLCDPDWCGSTSASAVFEGLLTGALTLKRKPWKPAKKDEYYFYDVKDRQAFCGIWDESFFDLMFYKVGNCYRTKEAAEADGPKWQEFYKSDEVLEWK